MKTFTENKYNCCNRTTKSVPVLNVLPMFSISIDISRSLDWDWLYDGNSLSHTRQSMYMYFYQLLYILRLLPRQMTLYQFRCPCWLTNIRSNRTLGTFISFALSNVGAGHEISNWWVLAIISTSTSYASLSWTMWQDQINKANKFNNTVCLLI